MADLTEDKFCNRPRSSMLMATSSQLTRAIIAARGAARLAARGAGAAARGCGWLRSAHLTFGHNLRAEWRNSPNKLPPVMAPSKYMMAERIATGALALSPRNEIVTVSRF